MRKSEKNLDISKHLATLNPFGWSANREDRLRETNQEPGVYPSQEDMGMIKDYCKFIWSLFVGTGMFFIILLLPTLFLSAVIVPGVACDHAMQTGQSIFYFYGIAGGVLCLLSGLTEIFLINWAAEKSGKDFFPKTLYSPPCSQGKATHVNCPGCGAARNGNQCDYCGMTTESARRK